MPHKITIHGHTVYYEDSAHEGMKYLNYDLDANEADVLFHQAREHEHDGAPFENEKEQNFTLKYKNGAYYIETR